MKWHFKIVGAGLLVYSSLFAAESGAPQAAFPAPAQHKAPALQDNPAYLLDLALVHFRYGALDQAQPLLAKVMEKGNPQQKSQASSILSDLLIRQHDPAGAAKVMETALASLPEGSEPRARMLLQLAGLYTARG